LGMLAANGLWIGLLFGMASARFRVLAPIVGSVMQVAFFLPPVMWLPNALSGRLALLLEVITPFASFLAVIRDPLLGQAPPLVSWAIVLAITVLGWLLAFAMFARFRGRITYLL